MDEIKVEILEDGTISCKTEEISQVNHLSADQLLEEIETLIGGPVKRTPVQHPYWKNRAVLRGGKIVKIGG